MVEEQKAENLNKEWRDDFGKEDDEETIRRIDRSSKPKLVIKTYQRRNEFDQENGEN